MKQIEKTVTVIMWTVITAALLIVGHYAGRILICDSFLIKGVSMEPTLHDGQKVYVRKYVMGPRIYTDFSFEDGAPLKCFRLPGFRRLKVGDIAVFNSPEGQGWAHIGFKINYVYAKRCLGTAGDTVRIADSHYLSSGLKGQIVPLSREVMMRSLPDSFFVKNYCLAAGQFAGEQNRWTIKDFGPIVVPFRGMAVPLDSVSIAHYSRVIEYETGLKPQWPDESLPDSYTFRENYCFFVGDNAPDSRDSRYFGFIPEKYVIGII